MTPQGEPTKPIQLGERLFRAARTMTARRDDYLHGRRQLSGVDKVFKEEGESPEEYAVRLLGHLRASGYVGELIGALITPLEIDDLDWTPAIAADTAAYTDRLHDPKDKEQRNVILLTLLIDSFLRGLSSSSATESSSNPDGEAQPALQQ